MKNNNIQQTHTTNINNASIQIITELRITDYNKHQTNGIKHNNNNINNKQINNTKHKNNKRMKKRKHTTNERITQINNNKNNINAKQ